MALTGMGKCRWCGREMTRHGLKSHERIHCEQRPDLVRARAKMGAPPFLPEVAPNFRPSPRDGRNHACRCGKDIRKDRMSRHAIACSWARQDGWAIPKAHSQPCECGCGQTVTSVGVKRARFAEGHYDAWYRANRKPGYRPRPLPPPREEIDEREMAPIFKADAKMAVEAQLLGEQIQHSGWQEKALALYLDVPRAHPTNAMDTKAVVPAPAEEALWSALKDWEDAA